MENILEKISQAQKESQNTPKKILKSSSSKKLMNSKSRNYLLSNSQFNLHEMKNSNKKKNTNIYQNKSQKNNQILKESIEKEEAINMEEYLSTSFDENDYDDVIDKEKRTFYEFLVEKLQENQIFINSLFIKEPFKPRSLKILILLFTIELYFVINALFYTQKYLSKILFIEGKDSFFAFIPRRINYFIYIFTTIEIISYFIEYFFTEEKKIKKLFIRNKKGKINLNVEISKVLSKMRIQLFSLIIFIVIFTIFFFFYITCFNIVYPNSQIEWIKSSLFILIITQLINFLFTSLWCSMRYIAIKCNSNKLFNISILLNRL